MDEDSRSQPLLDRPVRSLLDVKIGTVLKAYGIYLAIGFVIFLIGAIVILASWGHASGAGGVGTPGSVSWDPKAGETVAPAEFKSVQDGARLEAVRSRFGEPATTGHNPLDMVSGDTQSCLDYRSSVSSDSLFLFCFENGRLVEKQKF